MWLILLGKQFRLVVQPHDEHDDTESRRSCDILASLQTGPHSVSQAITFTSSLTELFDYSLEKTLLFESNPNNTNRNYLNKIKERKELFYEEKTKRIVIHTKAQWHEHGEKVPKFKEKNSYEKGHSKTLN